MAIHHPVAWTVAAATVSVLVAGVGPTASVVQKGTGAAAAVAGIGVGSIKPATLSFMAGKAAADARAAAEAQKAAAAAGKKP